MKKTIKTTTIELNDKQVECLLPAIDFYMRLKLGQMGELKDMSNNVPKDNVLRKLQQQLFPKLTGLNHSYSINGKDSPQEVKVCYDIYKQLHYISNPVGVYGYEPMPISKQGLPKIYSSTKGEIVAVNS